MDLAIAGVNINAVNCERLQAGDLQLTLCHRLFHKLVLSDHRLQISGAAAVASSLERRDSAVGVQSVAAGESGVGDANQISTPTIWWSEREKVGRDVKN